MANENQGRGNNFPDSADLWNEGDRFTFPLLHNEVCHTGNRVNGPFSSMQLQVSSSPTGNFHGEPAHCIGHASAGSMNSMMSNVTQHNSLHASSLHNPAIPGGIYQAESNNGTSFSALSRSQTYDLNHNVQKQDGLSGSRSQPESNSAFYKAGSSDVLSFSALDRSQSYYLNHNVPKQDGTYGRCSQLDINRGVYQAESSDVKSFSALNGVQSYDLNHSLQIHDLPPDSGRDVNILSHGPHNWAISQVDSSNLDGRFLSLGHNDSAGSTWESYASAVQCDGSRLSFPPSEQETSHGPFYPQNLPSDTIGCLALSNNGYGTLPGLSSGLDVSSSLPSSGQLFYPNQLISAANGLSPVTGNHMISTDTASRAYQIIPSASHSNGQFRSSESGSSWMPRLPSEATTTSGIRQQLTAVENHGPFMTSSAASSFQPPTCFRTPGTSSKKNEHDQASQRRFMHAPTSGSCSEISIAPDNAVSSRSRTEMVHGSNVVAKSSLKRGSSITSEPPRKLIRNHTVSPSHFLVNPSLPQSSAFTSISQQLIQQSFQPPKTVPHQNTPRTTVPAFTPPSNPFSIDSHAKTAPALQQTPISKITDSYPNYSPAASTSTTHRPISPSWCHHPSAMSLLQISNPLLNSLERPSPQFGAAGNVSSTTIWKAVHRAAVGKPSPVFKAAGNSSTRPIHTAQNGSLSILSNRTSTAPVPCNRTAAAERAKIAVRRYFERQSHALAAFQKNTADPHSSVTTSHMPHIRWRGVGEYKPEARGLKCLLCKRDLAYEAEGPVQIAPCPPDVAALPCGHIFHDHCLVAITPEDQRLNPPCIPCSMNSA